MKRSHIVLAVFAVFILFTLSSCAPEGVTTKEYGFFYGMLHGFTFYFALIGKLFNADVGIYAINNTGFFYWLGYIIGVSIIGGGLFASKR